MTSNHPDQSRDAKIQIVLATVCIILLSIVYLVGQAAWSRVVAQSQRVITPPQPRLQAPVVAPDPIAFAPDVVLPTATNGMAPVIFMVPTKQPVVFLTVDDGVYKEPTAAASMRAARVPASLFLVQHNVSQAPGYFSYIAQQTGSAIEDHTLDHKDLPTLGYADQYNEICTTAGMYNALYGKRPTLFRPPYGDYNADTRRAAASCGMRAIVMWHALVQGGSMQYQIGNSLRPGDIVLMHFTPNFRKDLQAFIDASRAAGLTPQLLEDWLH